MGVFYPRSNPSDPAWKSAHLLRAPCPGKGKNEVGLDLGNQITDISHLKEMEALYEGLYHHPPLDLRAGIDRHSALPYGVCINNPFPDNLLGQSYPFLQRVTKPHKHKGGLVGRGGRASVITAPAVSEAKSGQ